MSENDSQYNDLVQKIKSGTEGKRDTDLGGMDAAAAHEYVLAFATALKETEKARAACEQELLLWTQRVGLAENRNEASLAAQAGAKVEEITLKCDGLRREETELRRKVSFMKDELTRLKSKPELSLDPDALLAQFDMVLGAPDTTLKKIKDEEAALELEKLKKKLREEGGE